MSTILYILDILITDPTARVVRHRISHVMHLILITQNTIFDRVCLKFDVCYNRFVVRKLSLLLQTQLWVNFDVLRILCFPFPELLAAHLQQYVSSFLYTGIYNHCIDWLSLLFVIVIVIIYVIIYSGTVL